MSRPASYFESAATLDHRPLRFVTAASLFDGHDASINIMRRILQSSGVEVIHLGHNRSVAEIVNAAIQEDADALAVSSYQGGHVEFFTYMVDSLKARGAEHIQVFGGGGGVIVAEEIEQLHGHGVARIYSPEDGQSMGLQGMIDDMIELTEQNVQRSSDIHRFPEHNKTQRPWQSQAVADELFPHQHHFSLASHQSLAKLLSRIEDGLLDERGEQRLMAHAAELANIPVLGITGTGGSGKSSLTDELILRFRLDQQDAVSIALLAIDPTRRKSGGALLGDRIRMNAIEHENIFVRSVATRDAHGEVPDTLATMVAACKLAGVKLVIVETPGIGQGDAGIVSISDVSLYVMTPEFGAASQLEKIDMLDFADLVAINKLERKGGADALRDVRKQVQRNREAFGDSPDDMPVFGTIAARFNDDGVTALYHAVVAELAQKGLELQAGQLPAVAVTASTRQDTVVPGRRQRYLARDR